MSIEMVNLVMLFLGIVFTVLGRVFYQDPQAGFQIHNFPFVSSDDGLTEAGKTPYRIRGMILMAAGLLFIIASVFS